MTIAIVKLRLLYYHSSHYMSMTISIVIKYYLMVLLFPVFTFEIRYAF